MGKKIKTYIITLSQKFPAYHPRKGEPTGFRESFRVNKIHTIRRNYPLWEKRITEITSGDAVLSIRQWTGKPYCSKQIEIAKLTKDDGVGLQMFFPKIDLFRPTLIDGKSIDIPDIAHNDGLSFKDWLDWFSDYNFTEPMAIIHFTDFRY